MEGKPEQPNNSPEDFIDETKRNQFGLPEKWAKIRSSQALENIRKRIVNNQITSRQGLDSEIKRILSITGQEYKKYKGESALYSTISSQLTDNFESTGPYLKMDRSQKLEALKSVWPKGLPILRTNFYLKWEAIIDYEMWSIKNHGQILSRIANRNGFSASEALAVVTGTNFEDTDGFNQEKILSWFKENKMLMEL